MKLAISNPTHPRKTACAARWLPVGGNGSTSRPEGLSMIAANRRLRKHADYQRVYKASRKQFGKQMSYFFLLHGPDQTNANADGARVGLTVSKAMGKAVERNRIKRRMREAVRRQLELLPAPVDVVLHPRRSVIDLDFATLEREVASVFRAIRKAAQKASAQPPAD
jgi:ribonuclease P protein component